MYEQAPRPEPRLGPSSKKYNQRLGNLGRYAEIAGAETIIGDVGEKRKFEGVENWIDMLKLPSGSHVQGRLPRTRIRRLRGLDQYAKTAGAVTAVSPIVEEL